MQIRTMWLNVPESGLAFLASDPAVIVFIFVLKLSSGLALYWLVSNCFTATHTYTVHRVVRRCVESGALQIP